MTFSPDDLADAYDEVNQVKRMMYDVVAQHKVKYPIVILACYDLMGTILIMAVKENRDEYAGMIETLFEDGSVHDDFEAVIRKKIKTILEKPNDTRE